MAQCRVLLIGPVDAGLPLTHFTLFMARLKCLKLLLLLRAHKQQRTSVSSPFYKLETFNLLKGPADKKLSCRLQFWHEILSIWENRSSRRRQKTSAFCRWCVPVVFMEQWPSAHTGQPAAEFQLAPPSLSPWFSVWNQWRDSTEDIFGFLIRTCPGCL